MAEEISLDSDTQSMSGGVDPKSALSRVLSKTTEELMPWEDCQLPSKGVYYNGLIPDGMIQVRPMGIHADKILATQRLAKTGASLDWLFENCVKLPNGVDPLDLLTGDRVFLLYYLRGITHGNEYEFSMTCPECEEVSIQMYNFNLLWETVKGPDPDLGLEPFMVTLPYLSETEGVDFWVKVRFLRGRDTMGMLGSRKAKARQARRGPRNRSKEQISQKRDNETLDETLERNINLIIEEVMTERDRGVIQQFIQRMHSSDVAVVRDFIRENAPGIDTMIETDCDHCGTTVTIDLPITEAFFRPARSRGD